MIMSIKKIGVARFGILLFLFFTFAVEGVHAADLDITPLFAGYEKGCEISGTSAERLIVWANSDETGRIAPISALPAEWRDHVEAPVILDEHDHWFVKVPLRDVRLHGLPVICLERWYSNRSGISGWALVLNASIDVVRRHIDENQFRLDENLNFKPELSADDSARITRLICDVSM